MMRTNTRKFKVLEFIGSSPFGVRYMDIERFIVEVLNGNDYDKKVQTRVWDYKKNTSRMAMVRVHKGVWGTNLCYGRDAILHKYCVKNAAKRWTLKKTTAEFIEQHYTSIGKKTNIYFHTGPNEVIKMAHVTPPVSMLAKTELPSDEIKGNSVPVSVTRYPMDAPAYGVPVKAIPADAPIIDGASRTFNRTERQFPVESVFDVMSDDELEIEAIRALKQVRKEREAAELAFLDASAKLSQTKKNVKDAEDILRKALGL